MGRPFAAPFSTVSSLTPARNGSSGAHRLFPPAPESRSRAMVAGFGARGDGGPFDSKR